MKLTPCLMFADGRLLLEDDIAGIQGLDHMHHGNARMAVTRINGRLDTGCPTVLGQQ